MHIAFAEYLFQGFFTIVENSLKLAAAATGTRMPRMVMNQQGYPNTVVLRIHANTIFPFGEVNVDPAFAETHPGTPELTPGEEIKETIIITTGRGREVLLSESGRVLITTPAESSIMTLKQFKGKLMPDRCNTFLFIVVFSYF